MDEKVEDKDKGVGIIASLKGVFGKMTMATKVKLLLLIVLVAVILVVSNNFINISDTSVVPTSNSGKYTYYVSSLDYSAQLEDKLEEVLSNLDGVGKVEVMISLESSVELVFAESSNGAKDNDSIFTNDSYTVDVSSPIIIDSGNREEPLIVKEILPKIKGVLVVLSGSESVATKLSIIQAVQSLLDVNVSNIQVLSAGQ